jgi:hypothetical protein
LGATPNRNSAMNPVLAWSVVADAPLRGLALAREAGTIVAWDEADRLYLLDVLGTLIVKHKLSARIVAAAISDDGSTTAVVTAGQRLILLDRAFEQTTDRATVPDPAAAAIDPLGRYVAIASREKIIQLYTCSGKIAGKVVTLQPISHLVFVPTRPILLAASAYGAIQAYEIFPGSEPGKLELEIAWKEGQLSSVGRLTTTGDAGMILASCFTHGVQRFNAEGKSEGSYHLGGSAAHAAVDFAGRRIAVATVEGELAILNRSGNVRWKTGLPRPAVALECDALGRYLIYALATGEIDRLDLESTGSGAESASGARAAPKPLENPTIRSKTQSTSGAAGSIRRADWTMPIAKSDADADSIVLAVLDDPPRVAVIGRDNRATIYDQNGRKVGVAPEIIGVGRILRVEPGFVVAATDRMIAIYDVHANTSRRLDMSFAEISHLEPRLERFGLAIIQERDRLGRASAEGIGRWIWRREIESPVEYCAIGRASAFAATTEDGLLRIFDAAGEPLGSYGTDPAEPLALIEAPEGSPREVAWLTLAHRVQRLRGHSLEGDVLWETAIPWESWEIRRIGEAAVVGAPDGRTIAVRGTGDVIAEAGPLEPPFQVCLSPDKIIWRVSYRDMNLICSDLKGETQWRAVVDTALGPAIAVGSTGVAVMLGRELAWFSHPRLET